MEKIHILRTKRFFFWVCIFVFILLAPGCDFYEEYQRTVHLSESLGSGSQFAADTHNGAIRVTGDQTDVCYVTARITGRAQTVEDARKVAESIDIQFAYSDGRFTAHVDKPARLEQRYYCIDYEIQLPLPTGLDLETHNGSIKVENVKGAISVSTHNGKIDCYNVLGNVQAQTHNGSINVNYDDKADVIDTNITTHNGSIDIKAPVRFSVDLNASTHNGLIKVSMPVKVIGVIDKNQLRGKIGKGLGNLYLHTHNGSITIR
jgi:DUF4097 and DUF4098 domain-containing protein YvlB